MSLELKEPLAPLVRLGHREPQFVVSVVSAVPPVRKAQLVFMVPLVLVAHLRPREAGWARSSGRSLNSTGSTHQGSRVGLELTRATTSGS